MRNQARFAISVLKQQHCHRKGNLSELQMQNEMPVLFPNLFIQSFIACTLFL